MIRTILPVPILFLLLAAAPDPGASPAVPPAPAAPAPSAAPAPAPGAERAAERVFQDVAERLGPSVVSIDTVAIEKGLRPDKAIRFRRAEGGASTGLIVSQDGLIVASAFFFKDVEAVAIRVRLHDGRELPAKMLGRDVSRGIAVLKIEAKGLFVPAACPRDEIKVGRWAIALGRALSADRPTVHAGIVSAINRISGRAIQTDAPLSPANYGGPLADAEGRIMGICVPLSQHGDEAGAAMYDSGIGFAIPLADILAQLPRLSKGDVIRVAFLGIQFDPERNSGGVDVSGIFPGSSAEGAGLQKRDVILELDGKRIDNFFQFQFEIGRRVAGDKVDLKIRRGAEYKTLRGIELKPMPEAEELVKMVEEQIRRKREDQMDMLRRMLEEQKRRGIPDPPPPDEEE